MPRIDGIGIEDADERPVLENEGIGFAAYDPAKITVSCRLGIAHERTFSPIPEEPPEPNVA
jgi:hypothetical protein